MKLKGSCHCGAVSVVMETDTAPSDFSVRACQCTFCRKHGARAVSDPNGQLTVSLERDDAAIRYQFDAKTADFLVCKTCGAYVCAVLKAEGAAYSTVNINVLDERTAFPDEDLPMVFDAESMEQRIARRVANWTPTTIVVNEA